MDKVTRQRPQTTTFFEEKGEPKLSPLTSLTNALLLGQTGSQLSRKFARCVLNCIELGGRRGGAG